MKFKNLVFAAIAVALVSMPYSYAAQEEEDVPTSSRGMKKFGVFLGLGGEPIEAMWSVNVAYNATSFLRATAGYGEILTLSVGSASASVSVFAVGVKGFVPTWNFSPTVGLNYAIFTASGGGTASGLSASAGTFATNFGFDWQTDGGFNLGFGAATAFASGATMNYYLQLGWFF